MIGYRLALADDLEAIHQVWWSADPRASGPNPWFAHVMRTGQTAVAARADRVVGFAGRRQLGPNTVITDCFVTPELQGQGIGTRLLRYLLPAGEPLLVLASTNPAARALYARLGMRPVTACPYLRARVQSSSLAVLSTSSYPVSDADRAHLTGDLRARLLTLGQASFAAVSGKAIESSIVGSGDDPAEVIAALVAHLGGEAELQMSEEHGAFDSLAAEEVDRDILMATPGAALPDFHRITFNGDLLLLT